MSPFIILSLLVCKIAFIDAYGVVGEEDDPVDINELKHVEISDYHGVLNAQTVNLLQNAESLDIRQSTLTPLQRDFLLPLKNLKKLSISNSIITEAHSDISACCKHIEKLELINSSLPKIAFNIIGEWPLKKLYLHREKVPKLEANSFKNSNLKEVTIVYSDLETIEDGAFNNLNEVEYLYLRNNKISKITKEILAPLKKLRVLDLQNNKLTKLTTDMIPPLPELEVINVSNNEIKEFNLEGVKQAAPKLREVEISNIDKSVDITKNGGVGLKKTAIL